ncbi:MAG: NAD(P)H-hydrate dehydratase, partial [Candidatus Aenigmatarchaeota archaeon]
GHIDVIASPEYTAINKTGSTFMTKGGFGDTLAGICGALLARGIDTFTAGCLGAYINGLAGEMASKKFGESVMASDLIKEIPNALKGR